MQQIALTGLGRVFVNKGSRNCGNFYKYHSSMKIDGVDKSVGDVTSIYAPDPKIYNRFVEVATISGAESRATSTLTGYLPLKNKGILEDLYNQKCSFDLQVHFGACSRPDDFNTFDSAIILKDVKLTSYGYTALTARTPDERAAIDETAAISIGSFYRVFNTNEGAVVPAAFVADTFPIAILNAGPANCGDGCDDRTDGCSIWIVPFVNAADNVVFAFTMDNGASWSTTSSNSADTHTQNEQMCAAIVDEEYIYYSISNATLSNVYRTRISSILNLSADTIKVFESETTTPDESFIYDLVASDTYIWAVGNNEATDGMVYAYNKYTRQTEQFPITSGAAFYSVYAYDDNNVVVAGDLDTVYYSNIHGVFIQVAVAPTSLNYISSVHMFSPSHWIIGASGGFYCTSNSGDDWTQRNTANGTVKMAFYDDILGYAVDEVQTFRTLDSGNTWLQIATSTNELVHNVVICPDDPNIYWAAVGLAATPGFLLKGTA